MLNISVFSTVLSYLLLFSSTGRTTPLIDASFFINSLLRKELTREYCREHYSVNSWKLEKPQMIVIHYTGNNSLAETVRFLSPDTISSGNTYTKNYGSVNLGVHFFVDKDGSIYQFLPENMIARHTIGYNHISFGIENIARGESLLTDAQVQSNAALVAWLKRRHPSIRFLIGHHEYMLPNTPYLYLYTAENDDYFPMHKPDPGPVFMSRLRDVLAEKYLLVLEH